MAHKYPEVRRVRADRVRELYNRRQNYCYTSPIYREKVRAIDRKLAERFGHDPAVILWHISNEMGANVTVSSVRRSSAAGCSAVTALWTP